MSVISTANLKTLDKHANLCHTNSMNKTNAMTDFPTDFELRELQAEVDAELELIQAELDADAWADSMMMGMLEDIQY